MDFQSPSSAVMIIQPEAFLHPVPYMVLEELEEIILEPWNLTCNSLADLYRCDLYSIMWCFSHLLSFQYVNIEFCKEIANK